MDGQRVGQRKAAAGAVSTFEASSLAELPNLLVKARVARGWTQRDPADAVDVAEQQMQRYEATGRRAWPGCATSPRLST